MTKHRRNNNLQRTAFVLVTGIALAACGVEQEPAPALEGGDLRTDKNGLVLDGHEDDTMVLETRSRHFESLDAFAAYATKHLGATVVRDDDGVVTGVRIETFVSGKMLFKDTETGEVYEDDDFLRGFLGGSARTFTIGERAVDASTLAEGIGTSAHALIPSSAEGCTPNGVDCIRGETWKNNYLVYSSMGSKTEQSRGGYSPVNYQCCRSNESLVTVSGLRRCRSYPNAIRERDEFTGKIIVINVGPPAYRTPDQCSYQTRRNTLAMSVRRYFGPNSSDVVTRTAIDAPEAKWSVFNIPAVNYGVSTMCGYHSGSRGTPVRTSKGFTGDNDILCNVSFSTFSLGN